MSDDKRQVFQTNNPTRWQRFKWGTRIIIAFIVLLFAILITMLFVEKSPQIPIQEDAYRSIIAAEKPYYPETKLSRQYKGFRKFFTEKSPHFNHRRVSRKVKNMKQDTAIYNPAAVRLFNTFYFNYFGANTSSRNEWKQLPAGVRSAFFVDWDAQSFASLKRNIGQLNLVMPEWFFVDPQTDTLTYQLDEQGKEALRLMTSRGLAIMPMLSNNYNREFRTQGVDTILTNPAKAQKLINRAVAICLQNHFAGINVDFESIDLPENEPLSDFIQKISTAFHAKGLLVSADIPPFNTDYDLDIFGKYCDYLVLMAYDEHTPDSDPGPVSSQKWIESALDNMAAKVPNEKIILGLAQYGYQWPASEDSTVSASLSYQQALSLAGSTKAPIRFDEDTYNLSFSFAEKDNAAVTHQVYFTDAATAFNTMRFATEYGLAGTAVWRLGSEDERIWNFYKSDMRKDSIARFNFNKLSHLSDATTVDYNGDGEVLDVLNTPHTGHITTSIDSADILITGENYDTLPSTYVIQKYGAAPQNELVLTFDDGPSAEWTPKILDILSRYHVPAAFFLVGLQAEKNLPLVKRLYREGHEIGDHTFTHPNIAKQSKQHALMEIKLTRLLIECITGHSTILFRAPYNADAEPTTLEEIIPVVDARKENFLDIGESIDPEDWEPGVTADTIVARVIEGVKEGRGNIILLHDAGGDTRAETVKALPRIIEYFQKRGYTFTSLANILHKRKDELMPPVPAGSGYYMMQFNLALAKIGYWLGHFLEAMFILFIFLGLARLVFMTVLAAREKRRISRLQNQPYIFTKKNAPLVSIIVPAYNEEVNAVPSLNNLLLQTYPNFTIVFVDDGSKDATYEKVSAAFAGNNRIKVVTKPNGGKASALNYGMQQTDANFLVCIDADTKLATDALEKLMQHFFAGNQNTGAVAGNVKVGNQVNLLTKWQQIEYVTSQNFDRMAFANVNAITVVPGAIGAFTRQAIEDAGGFTSDTLAEDADLTMRILRAGYIIDNENDAIAFTEVPESIRQFVKQRTRWSFGVMQSFWKHRDLLFSGERKNLGWIALPNILIYQFIIPFFSPIADVLMLIGLTTDSWYKILTYYLIFTLVDISVSLAAFVFEKEKKRNLIWIIPQRFCYRWIMYLVLFKSLRKAVKGELQHWGVLKRSGNVQYKTNEG